MGTPLYEEPKVSVGIDKYNSKRTLLTISGDGNNDIAGDLFVTNFGGDVRPNFQIMYSMGPEAYLNVFSQRLSAWNLDGVYVPSGRCPSKSQGGDTTGRNNDTPGFYKMYERYNIANNDNKFVKLVFSGLVVEAYITSMSIPSFSKTDVGQMRFSLKLLGRIKHNTRTNTTSSSS